MNPFMQGGILMGDRYQLRQANMVDLIRTAYGVDADNVLGGPSWLELDRFDVIAKTPPATPPETLKLMLQALLADRFKLVVHKDSKPFDAFVLSVGKGKPKLKEADGSGEPGCQSQPLASRRARQGPAHQLFLPQHDHGSVRDRGASNGRRVSDQPGGGFDRPERRLGFRPQMDRARPARPSRSRRHQHLRRRR